MSDSQSEAKIRQVNLIRSIRRWERAKLIIPRASEIILISVYHMISLTLLFAILMTGILVNPLILLLLFVFIPANIILVDPIYKTIAKLSLLIENFIILIIQDQKKQIINLEIQNHENSIEASLHLLVLEKGACPVLDLKTSKIKAQELGKKYNSSSSSPGFFKDELFAESSQPPDIQSLGLFKK
ncbi:MAG: hypothetical protein H0U70_07975 [Tatlockia sp.]|nr:hypothetical protein [Tatlockia sp.]